MEYIIGGIIGLLIGIVVMIGLKSKERNNQNLHIQSITNELSQYRKQYETLQQEHLSLRNESINWMQQANEFEAKYDISLQTNEDLHIQLKREIEKWETILIEKHQLISHNASLSEQLDLQKKEVAQLHEKSKLEFEQIAQKLLEEKSDRFTELNKKNIEAILKPLNENISVFKKQVEDTYDKESKIRFSLDERIKELMQQTTKISSEANNLTNALKGNHKKQGDWGEMILESILQQSGLVKDREYRVQNNLKNDEQSNIRPDIIVELPQEKNIVIDSKVSLVAYDNYCSAETNEEQHIALSQHLKSLRTHIDQLSQKNYHQHIEGLDFTMLFVPIEPAYLLAMQNDSKLWNDAYQKRILLISPTNLIACLKLIVDLWNRDKQDKSAMNIVKQSEKMYDKMVNFMESFEKIGRQIQNAQDSYQSAMNQMKMGRGNLMSQTHQLLQYGINPKKRLPEDFEDNELI